MDFSNLYIDWNLVQQIAFFVFAFITVGGALYVLFTNNVLHAIFGLLLTFLGIAGLYIFAGADFIAVTQLMIYVGGILILLIFGIMLTRKKETLKSNSKVNEILVGYRNLFWAIIVGLSFFIGLIKLIFSANFVLNDKLIVQEKSITKIGIALMTDYIFAFEVIGILLLIALIGATYIAKKEKNESL